MLIINEEDISDIKSMANANPAAMIRIVAMLDRNFREIDETLAHLDPNPD